MGETILFLAATLIVRTRLTRTPRMFSINPLLQFTNDNSPELKPFVGVEVGRNSMRGEVDHIE